MLAHANPASHRVDLEGFSPRPNAARATATVQWMGYVVATYVLMALLTGAQLWVTRLSLSGYAISTVVTGPIEMVTVIALVAFVLVHIVAAVVYIRWFRRAYYNLHLFPVRARFGEGWAAGAWFVPILNLFRPYQIMKELFRKTGRLLRHEHPDLTTTSDSRIVDLWWAAYIMLTVIERVSSVVDQDYPNLDELAAMQTVSLLFYCVGVPAALLCLRVVRRYARLEELLASACRTGEEAALDSFVGETV